MTNLTEKILNGISRSLILSRLTGFSNNDVAKKLFMPEGNKATCVGVDNRIGPKRIAAPAVAPVGLHEVSAHPIRDAVRTVVKEWELGLFRQQIVGLRVIEWFGGIEWKRRAGIAECQVLVGGPCRSREGEDEEGCAEGAGSVKEAVKCLYGGCRVNDTRFVRSSFTSTINFTLGRAGNAP